MAIALSPSVVGLQVVVLEALGVPFHVSANAVVFLNLPCAFLLVSRLRSAAVTGGAKSWLSFMPSLAMLVCIPVLLWSLIPGLRTYEWETMLHTDVVYTIARNGLYVEETNLAGLSLAYGWVGHTYWSVIGWIGDWAPTTLYPFTNLVWIIVTFILSYQLGKSGLELHKTTALLGVTLMFLSTNVVGIVLFVATGYSEWWERYFGDMRYSPFLNKFYAFDTMLWGMALLIALALVYSTALRSRATPLDGLGFTLLVSLGLIYPLLVPAGWVIVSGFLFLTITRLPKELPNYTHAEIARLGLALLFSVIIVLLYLGVVTADREIAAFALSRRWDIHFKAIRFWTALSPLLLMAVLPVIGFLRRRNGPALLLTLSALAFSAVYTVIDLASLEYKYVLAATICLAFLAAAAVDPLFQRRPRLGYVIATIVVVGLGGINLLLVFKAHGHIPGNVEQGAQLDEGAFWIGLDPSEPDAIWTKAIHEYTSENTVVIAQRPGIQLSAVVGRSMYVPSDIDGGYVPGYNLNQRSYLLEQRGYPAQVYEHRLEVVKALYSSRDEAAIIDALHDLKELRRPIAIYFSSQDTYSLHWLETQSVGHVLVSDGQNTAWYVDDPGTLP
jgi:hypothetical protein